MKKGFDRDGTVLSGFEIELVHDGVRMGLIGYRIEIVWVHVRVGMRWSWFRIEWV